MGIQETLVCVLLRSALCCSIEHKQRALAHRATVNMEYERALFRVYDKSMEGFRSPSVRNVCNLAQKLLLIVSAGCFAALVLLHHQFVNNPGIIQYEYCVLLYLS